MQQGNATQKKNIYRYMLWQKKYNVACHRDVVSSKPTSTRYRLRQQAVGGLTGHDPTSKSTLRTTSVTKTLQVFMTPHPKKAAYQT